MKKRVFVWAVLLLAAGMLFVLLRGQTPQPLGRIEPADGRDFMRASLTYDEGLRTIRGTQTLTAKNRTGQDLPQIVLRLYMNGWEGCSAAVSGVTVNGEIVPYTNSDPTVVTIERSWASGEEIEISWTVMAKHARGDGVPVILLSSLAMWENGAWRTDSHDPLAQPSYAAPFDVQIELDGEIVSSLRMARDAGFALPAGMKLREKEIGGVRVRALARDAGTAKALLDQAITALESLGDVGIMYPFDVLTVADAKTARAEGLALSGLVALDAAADGETGRMTRLIAQEIFGVMIENDPWNAPWLSETLAASAEMLAYRARRGTAAYEERLYGEMELAGRITRPVGVTVGASVAHFGSDAEMTQVLAQEGAAALLGIEQAVGEEAFIRALQIYIQSCGGRTGSQSALADALARATGSNWDGYLCDMLGN